MKTIHDTTDKNFNISFTQELLKQYEFYGLKNIGSSGLPTKNGHGPFIQLSQGSVVFDLRCYNERKIFGNSHPLELRSVINQKLMSTRVPKSDEILAYCAEQVRQFHTWQFPYVFLKEKVFVPSGLKLIKPSALQLCELEESCIGPQQIKPLIYLNHDEYLSHKSNIKKVFSFLTKHEIEFGIIEENILGLSSRDLLFTQFTDLRPIFLATNYNLGIFVCWSDISMNETDKIDSNLTPKLDLLHSFTRYLYEANVFGKQGHIQRLSEFISSKVNELKISNIQQDSLHISFSSPDINLESLLRCGIMAYELNNKTCFNFPLSIKKNHISEVFEILKQQEN